MTEKDEASRPLDEAAGGEGVFERTEAFERSVGALRSELEVEVADRESDWNDFSTLLWARIDDASPEVGGSPVLDAALREDLEQVQAEADWSSFEALVWARVDETPEDGLASSPEWSQISAALREDHAAELAEFEARHSEFTDGFSLRWAEDADRGASTVGDVLRSEVATAVDEKNHAWSAFAHQVMVAITHPDPQREDLSDRALAALRADVASELDALAPRFDGDFKEGVERRIFRAGQSSTEESRPWWSRVSDALTDWLQPAPGYGLAAAAAAAAFLVVVRPGAVVGPEQTADAGQVSISAVRFDGTVTVMPDEGIAVVWVTGDAS